MGEDGHQGFRFTPVLVGLLGVLAGAVMVATYRLFYSLCNCRRRQMLNNANTSQNVENNIQQERPSNQSINSSTPRLVPMFRYSKDCNEEICAVCLSDFKDGEQVRVLSACLHFFHVACVDAWLNLHSNCPVCRAGVSLPPEQVTVPFPDSTATPPPVLN